MAEKNWITLKNGVHVPVEANQSNKEAAKTFLQKIREKKKNQSKKDKHLSELVEKNTKSTEEKNKKVEKDYQKIRIKEYLKSVKENPQKEILRGNSNNSWLLTETRGFGKEEEGWEIVKHGQVFKNYKDRQEAYNDWDNGYFEEDSAAQDKKEIDINGYVTYYDVPMTKAGVFPYLGKTISPELEPDKVYNVLRPIEELTKPETMKSLEAVPLVIDHTMIGEGFTKPEDKGVEGTTLQNVKVKGDLITNDLTAYTDRCRQAIDAGKRDLSMGYRCRYDLTSGEYKGQHYDAVQRDIIYNHIALVDEGRMGAECRVTDNSIVYDSLDINLDNKKEFVKMAKITLDEDLKQEIKEEIKKELLDGGAEIIEKKEDVIDETAPEVQEPAQPAEDEDTDKRKLIDEIGGILKGKVDDELIRTVMQKAEELAYNPSETGANDCTGAKGQDADAEAGPEKKDDEEKKEGLSMDEAVKYFAKRDNLINRLKPVIGDNVNYNQMTVEQVVKYGCDKLDIPVSLRGLEGYLTASEKHKKTYVTIAKDSAERQSNTAAFLQAYKSKD